LLARRERKGAEMPAKGESKGCGSSPRGEEPRESEEFFSIRKKRGGCTFENHPRVRWGADKN